MYEAVHRQLVETGEWDRLLAALNRMLSESGWTDDMRNRSREKARSMQQLSFKTILDDIQAGTATVSPQVKVEMMKLIRETLEQFVEA
ncbi:hypothetical protein EXIGLDRAFT_66103 [Exidia glandulosa HHB12029]|uniref:Transcription and mRNA export factor SUS1 n=1 Tax=Exidia glandulosa HHB12029 TaxID=1314781 RepID=A0A165P399_EXIGL|nr:hypothetical protein EXIGLDRAFT_66103 [Exidia glandulosa HHB12029]